MFRDKRIKDRRRGVYGWAKVEKVEKGTDKDKPTKARKKIKRREIFEEADEKKKRKKRDTGMGWDKSWVMWTKKNTRCCTQSQNDVCEREYGCRVMHSKMI